MLVRIYSGFQVRRMKISMKSVFLILAIAGTIVPYGFLGFFIAEHGLSVRAFVAGLFVNGAGWWFHR